MANLMKYGNEAREALKAGMDKLADAVKATLGPKGRYVIVQRKRGAPVVTNDGVTIAKSIEVEDPFENQGAQLMREISSKTNDVTGDGTTTACVLAQALIHAGNEAIKDGANPTTLKNQIGIVVEAVLDRLKKSARQIDLESSKAKEEIAHIATISAGDAEIGGLVAEAIMKVGKDGVVTVEEGKTHETKLRVTEGMQFDGGMVSHYFVTDQARGQCVLDNPLIILSEQNASYLHDYIEILKDAADTGRPILLIAPEVEGDLLPVLVANHVKKQVVSCGVKAPGFGDLRKNLLDDIATLTGAEVFGNEKEVLIKNAKVEMLGSAERVIIEKDKTTIISGGGDKKAIQRLADSIRVQIAAEQDKEAIEILRERLAKLTNGIVVIEAGAATETEMRAKKYKIEDAMHAAQAAVTEGFVAGGGIALLRIAEEILNHKDGQDLCPIGLPVVVEALRSPIKTIADNAARDSNEVICTILAEKNQRFGYDAARDRFVEDVFEAGIIDPVKVTRTALENAVSIVNLLLNSEVIVTEIPKAEPVFPFPFPR